MENKVKYRMKNRMKNKMKDKIYAKCLAYGLALLLLMPAMTACQPGSVYPVRSEMVSSQISGVALEDLTISAACAILKATEAIAKMVGHQLWLVFGYSDPVGIYRSVQLATE